MAKTNKENSTASNNGNHFKNHIHDWNVTDNNMTNLNTTAYDMGQQIHHLVVMDASCRTFEFCISFILVGITCVFGCIGNTLSILTLHRDSIKSATTFLLSALAVADIMFLVPAVFVIMIPTYCEFYQHCQGTLHRLIPALEQFGWAIASTCHTCSVYMTVLVAIHRYLWVCRPDLAPRFSGKS